MPRRGDTWFLLLTGSLFIILISALFILANETSGSEHTFGGFLLNPIDGNSYLAKMYQGSLGNWQFKFPYTADPGNGAYIFLYYLFLGKLAELTGLSLQFTFHSARIAGSILMLLALWNFYTRTLDSQRSRWFAFGFALFGSGLGWFAVLFGAFTADFWVAEGYPFLAAFANPHFPLGLAVLVYLLTPGRVVMNDPQGEVHFPPGANIAAGALLLAIILPFGVVIAGIVYSGFAIWQLWERMSSAQGRERYLRILFATLCANESSKKLVWLLAGGLPIIAYEIWLTRSDPIFAEWNAQNLTASPPVWDLFISYAPLMLLAVPGGFLAMREEKPALRILVIWAVISALLIYIPWGLQRRFLLGYAIPLAGLTGMTLDALFRRKKVVGLTVLSILVILVIPTNTMIIIGGLQAIKSRDARIFLSQEELLGMEWIATQTPRDARILSGPDTGLYIPAYTGRTVYYGHPFETVDAEYMEAAVTHFFDGTIDDSEGARLAGADYIFYGPREASLGILSVKPNYQLMYASENLRIYLIVKQSSKLEGDRSITDP